ncbi:hypothetical protein ACHQM5_009194 [Ranunculus cassubicifolius]
MSLLNQLFNRGLLGSKCKTCLNLAISRIKLLQNKRQLTLNQMRKEISQLLQSGQESIARIKVEHVIREMNMQAAYDILEIFCELVYARVPILESQRECPPEMKEAVASIIFAAPRCSDIPDLLHVRNLFMAKYGKEFASSASELRPDSGVNRDIIEKLSIKAPSAEVKLRILKEIAREYNLEWDASSTEAEFQKKHEDLLDGSSKMPSGTKDSQLLGTKNSTEAHTVNRGEQNGKTRNVEPVCEASKNMSLVSPDKAEVVGSKHNDRSVVDSKVKVSPNSCDAMEKARAAIASAERASAAARKAAELVNVKTGLL